MKFGKRNGLPPVFTTPVALRIFAYPISKLFACTDFTWFRCTLFLIALNSGLVSSVFGQNLGLTPEQLDQLQLLTPLQRAELLESLSSEPAEQIPSQPIEVAPRDPAFEESITAELATSTAELVVERSELEPFGYDLFAGSPTTFAPATNIPVPANYIVGPGDNVIVQLYGQQNATYDLIVTRDGNLLFPEIGPVSVSGLSFDELRQQIDDIVNSQLIGQRASITLGNLRSIRVFVLGEAFRPGSYTVSGLSTMTNALFVSGGVTSVGSLRNIQLRRQGETVATLDLYDLLLRGDTSSDQRLMPDDVLFIPPIGPTVGVSGEVIRPSIYELNGETTALDVLMLAGGLRSSAFPQASKIERIDEQGRRTVIDLDLSAPQGQAEEVRNGDLLAINPILDRLENVIFTEGHMNRAGDYQWRPGLRVTDVVTSMSELLPNPDLEYALIVRERQPLRIPQVLKLQLGMALDNPGSEFDVLLQPRDRIITFGAVGGRETNLVNLLEELRTEASFNNPAALVSVEGNVRFPGDYPYLDSMTVGDIINSAGGLLQNTDASYSVLVREIDNRGSIEVLNATSSALSLESSKAVQRGDQLLVFSANSERAELLEDVLDRLRLQSDSTQRTKIVTVSGQVKFPGEYPLYENMRAVDLIAAAGGFTESALTTEAELSSILVSGNSGRRVEHISINPDAASPILREFDSLVIRQLPNWTEPETIEISGEVVSPGTYTISKGEYLSSVIRRAGGLTSYADPNASILLRESLREVERELLNQYQEELEADIAAVAIEESVDSNEQGELLDVGNDLLDQVEEAEPLGRLVIEVPELLAGLPGKDVIALDGDQLFVPRTRQEISILGEVQFPTSHLFDEQLSVQDYLNLSGGLTQRADAKRTYVIKANGQVVPFGNSRWFFDRSLRLGPGDAIVVPFEIEPTNYFATWSSVSQILFNLATSVLAINSVQN